MLLAVVRVRCAHTLASLPTQMHGCRAIHCARVDKVHVRSGLHAKARVTAGKSIAVWPFIAESTIGHPTKGSWRAARSAPCSNLRAAHRVSCCLRSLFLHDERGSTTACLSASTIHWRKDGAEKGHRQRMMRALPVARRTHHESRHCTASSKRGSSKMTAGAAAHHQALVQYLFTLRCQNFGGRCHGRLCQLAYECSWPSICRSAQSPSLQHLWICAAST